MGTKTPGDPEASDDLLRRASDGDEKALAELFARHRERLRRMVQLRLDRRLVGRIDSSDVLQDTYIEVQTRFADYVRDRAGALPFFLWLRLLTGQKLAELYRRHLGAQMRDVAMEVSLHRGRMPHASSASLAAQLLGKLTSACRAAIRAEHRLIVQEALERMDPIDREILVLRHFEHLTNSEVVVVLSLSKTAASQRYIRALTRLREILATIPGIADEF